MAPWMVHTTVEQLQALSFEQKIALELFLGKLKNGVTASVIFTEMHILYGLILVT